MRNSCAHIAIVWFFVLSFMTGNVFVFAHTDSRLNPELEWSDSSDDSPSEGSDSLVKVGWDEEKILDHSQVTAVFDSIILVRHNWVYADHFPLGAVRDILDPPDRA
mgnify:FL=1